MAIGFLVGRNNGLTYLHVSHVPPTQIRRTQRLRTINPYPMALRFESRSTDSAIRHSLFLGGGGTFLPSLRASDRPMAIACLRLVTFFPLRPLFSLPCFIAFISRSTSLLADGLYFRVELDFFAAVFFAATFFVAFLVAFFVAIDILPLV